MFQRRESILAMHMPGREAHPPCVMLVPYITTFLPLRHGVGASTAAPGSKPISSDSTLL